MRQIANNMNISLSSSEQVSPNFWTDPKNGIPYYFAVQTPEYRIANKNDLDNTPIAGASPGRRRWCRTCSATSPRRSGWRSSRSTTIPTSSRSTTSMPACRTATSAAPRGDPERGAGDAGQAWPADRIVIRGQIDSMNQAFANLTIGLLFAAVFVYALMVVNYQSFVDPLAVILALPGAGSGIILLLFATGTTFSVPSLMGAIMAVGVASANSILLVTFAREQREAGMSAFQAALSAGTTRLRPVLMTAAAMIVGMLPMAIGGPGEEQNAVLARAVIGGVVIGTITTLLFVPYLYSVIGRRDPAASPGSAHPETEGTAS